MLCLFGAWEARILMDLRELYQSVILDHNQRPRNRGRLEDCTHHADGYNPLCGDMVVVDLLEKDGILEAIRFDGQGCAISTASASLMTDALVGKPIAEVHAILETMLDLFKGQAKLPESLMETELAALADINEYPVRIKCAILPWRTLESALSREDAQVSTE